MPFKLKLFWLIILFKTRRQWTYMLSPFLMAYMYFRSVSCSVSSSLLEIDSWILSLCLIFLCRKILIISWPHHHQAIVIHISPLGFPIWGRFPIHSRTILLYWRHLRVLLSADVFLRQPWLTDILIVLPSF